MQKYWIQFFCSEHKPGCDCNVWKWTWEQDHLQCCQVCSFLVEMSYFNNVVAGSFSCPRVWTTPIISDFSLIKAPLEKRLG